MKKQVDWKWANSLYELAIFEAAGLSLGYELNTLAPVDFRYTGREHTEPPPEYRERVILAYEATRAAQGLTPTGRTAAKGVMFDQNAEFFDGQCWNINPADFRRWCDAEGFAVPAEWVPRGYVPDTATPAPVVAVVAPSGTATIWTTERKTAARAMQNELRGQGNRAFAAKTAAAFGVTATRLREVLNDKSKKAPAKKPKGVWDV